MSDSKTPSQESGFLSRRRFISQSAGAGLVLAAPNILKAAEKGGSDTIHVAFVGFGKQAKVLFAAMKNIPGLYIQAVCDISEWNRNTGLKQARAHQGKAPNGYTNIDEMLEKEKGLDCAVVATPDFWHSPHTIKCLEAGLNVYCEKMMSNTIDGARAMVKAAEASGKLCQIGHQRRSNPRYVYTFEQLLKNKKIAGQLTNVQAQWNRALGSSRPIQMKRNIAPEDKVLKEYGFKDFTQYKDWRLYRDLSGGPISDLGAHQIDIFNWFLEAVPKRLYATGGKSYFKERDHFDNVLCVFDWEDTKYGEVRGFYQVLTTTSSGGGFWENFMGTEATIKTAEVASSSAIYREDAAPSWDDLVGQGYLKKKEGGANKPASTAGAVASYESAAPEEYDLPGGMPLVVNEEGKAVDKPAHQPHLENFFASVRGKATLNCDARHAFESEAPIFYINESALKKEPIELTPELLSV